MNVCRAGVARVAQTGRELGGADLVIVLDAEPPRDEDQHIGYEVQPPHNFSAVQAGDDLGDETGGLHGAGDAAARDKIMSITAIGARQ